MLNKSPLERTLHARASVVLDAAPSIVEISPSDVVRRHVMTWRGMAAESVQCTSQVRTKFGFRAPIHLLVAYEEGERRDGDTFVEGLPRSTLRHFARKLTFVPAGKEFCEWHDPRTPTRLVFVYLDQADIDANRDSISRTSRFHPGCFSRTRRCGARSSS